MPRVVTGEFRGTILKAPKGDNTRPTTDKVKEAVFSSIQGLVPGSSFLDIFSGTGQMAIEAVSRGAVSSVLIEKSGDACGIIRENLGKIRCAQDPRFSLIRAPYEKALLTLEQKFDIVYIDPPYRRAHADMVRISEILLERELLNEGAVVICEHSSDLPFDTDVINLKFNRSCSYGLTVITFFEEGR